MWLHKERLHLLPTAQTGYFLQRAGAKLPQNESIRCHLIRKVNKTPPWRVCLAPHQRKLVLVCFVQSFVKVALGVKKIISHQVVFRAETSGGRRITPSQFINSSLFLQRVQIFSQAQDKVAVYDCVRVRRGAVKYFLFFLSIVILLKLWPATQLSIQLLSEKDSRHLTPLPHCSKTLIMQP